MSKYLYGAAVQGIQQYIFRTNKLKDIVEASDKVKAICTALFEELLAQRGLKLNDNDHAVINAAGNVKYIFEKKEDCEHIVCHYPRLVLEFAPGITISQAVIEYDDQQDFGKQVNLLEEKLHSQRNKPLPSLTVGLMGIDRHRGTNLPNETQSKMDMGTNISLCIDAFGKNPEGKPYYSIFDTDRMNQDNDWIAVIHADGNGLGKIVQKIGGNREEFMRFSRQLDLDTKGASQAAFSQIKKECEQEGEDWEHIPIRPIVLGGDDFSVICRADIAIRFVSYFMDEFEKRSKENYKDGGLTVCAGIAFVKSSFPFYYAYDLAESLCSAAKKEAKANCGDKPAPSCLMFHKVQDSFVTDYNDIEARELTTKAGVSFKYGPYYLHEQPNRWTIGTLLKKAEMFEETGKEGNAIKSRLRNWMTLLNDNPGMAAQDLKRIKAICEDKKLRRLLDEVTNDSERIPVYDMLAVHTLNVQVTKTRKK